MQHEHLYNFLNLIPPGKVISYKTLATIFCTGPRAIGKLIGQNKELDSYACYKVVGSDGSLTGYAGGIPDKKHRLEKDGIVLHNNKVKKEFFWNPILTNYYVSLITKDKAAIECFDYITNKIKLLHPGSIVKTPTHYHITLADCGKKAISRTLIDDIFSETEGLLPFYFHCLLQRPFIDTKKEKVVFWIRLQNNPFLLTLQQCLKKHIPWRSDKQYIPHITLLKILKETKYNPRFDQLTLDMMCQFDSICITANVDQTKDQILFEKKLM